MREGSRRDEPAVVVEMEEQKPKSVGAVSGVVELAITFPE
jgi:hypothetical protein